MTKTFYRRANRVLAAANTFLGFAQLIKRVVELFG